MLSPMIVCLLGLSAICIFFFFFFNDTATTEIYTLSLHDALPISIYSRRFFDGWSVRNSYSTRRKLENIFRWKRCACREWCYESESGCNKILPLRLEIGRAHV